MNRTSQHLIKRTMLWISLAITLPVGVMAQQTVFYDNFATSTINGTSTNNGSATASYTSYDIASGKSATSTTIAPGHFGLECASTSAGYLEGQALFTSYPVTLATVGDSIDIQVVFTDTTNFFNNNAANAESFGVGLFYSGGSLPICTNTTGTNLWNGGLASSRIESTLGGVQNWIGYRGLLTYNPGASASSVIQTRPAQNQGNNQNQCLMQSGSGGYAGANTVAQQANSWVGLTLNIGSQYTVDYNISITSTNPLTLAFTNILYAGVGTSGTVIATNGGITSNSSYILTTNFDSFSVGGERTGSRQSTNDINQVMITATLAAQAGPYYVVSGTGGCGAQIISLNGSVTTNVYWLYTNGVNSGQSVLGTGSAISFGVQSAVAVYTVIASNTVTTSQGPMWGSAAVTQGPPIFGSAPASVICATNSIAIFSASASGNSLSYQWYKNNVPLSNGGDVSGVQTTNLVISPAQASDVGSYYLVVTNTCGYSVTSSPNAILTLEAPYNLVWQGNNPNDNWDLAATPNFLNGANPQDYTNGDNVTFNDSSANTTVSLVGTNIAPTLVTVTGTQNYIFGGNGSIAGAAAVLVSGSATLTFTNANNYSGGTIITNGASLDVGNGAFVGKLTGKIVVNSGSTLHYLPPNTADVTIQHNNVSGNGSILYDYSGNSHTITLDSTMTNSSFQGTMEIKPGCRLQVSTAYGLGGTNILVDFDPNTPLSASLYMNDASVTNSEAISICGRGPGSPIDTPAGFGALRLNGGWSGTITITGIDPTYGYTMIGAASGIATIIGSITDNGNGYELCYYGGTIRVGPTNGVQNIYGVTRISEQLNNPNISEPTYVIALNSNAFSTNTLNMNGQAFLELNGNNLQFDNLIDESLTYATSNYLSVIENGSSNAPAVISLGRDNNSSSYYGIFEDGASQSLGVTKTGTGMLTLTGDSTNTGPVTVSAGTLQLEVSGNNYPNGQPVPGTGSFSNATLVAVSNGATLDVSTRRDDTLTMNGGQTLKGSGTVNGNLIANAGSTVFPGDTIGTLNVSGSATINGTLLIGLNRTNPVANCSHLTAGSLSYAGTTLSTTNIGLGLQVGDTFPLFSAGTSGFASVALQTNDYANNLKYTWNNTIASNGKITVASVSQLTSLNPTNITITISGNNVVLSWPADHLLWSLQSQTNSLSTGLSTNWVTIPGTTSVNFVTNAINAGNGSVFYRLFYHP
jgi:fibronectin-binding autotransporter adhesin